MLSRRRNFFHAALDVSRRTFGMISTYSARQLGYDLACSVATDAMVIHSGRRADRAGVL